MGRPITVPPSSDAHLTLSPSELNHQAMIGATRQFWTGPLFRAVAAEANSIDPEDFAIALPSTRSYAALAWLETTLQRRKYDGRLGLIAVAERSRDRLVAALDDAAARAPDRLLLDDGIELPDYYTDRDIHLMPGGLYGRDIDGFVYEQAAGSTSMIGNERQDLQSVLADEIAEVVGATDEVATIVNLGCGFGKLEHFLHTAIGSQHRLIGCDLSAPVLRLAHLRAVERGQQVEWVQCRAEHVPHCADGTVDVVASVQLLHELPDDARLAMFEECHRMMRPGGRLLMIDFYPLDSTPLERFLYRGHTVRNGEPHLDSVLDAPLAEQLTKLGFVDVAVEATSTNSTATATSWRLPWARLAATKPAVK